MLFITCLKNRIPADFVRLDQDILTPLAGKKQLYTYETMDFWEQIKSPGYVLAFCFHPISEKQVFMASDLWVVTFAECR